MPSYLVVADQTAQSVQLLDRLREIAAADEGAEFVLVVPATPVRHLLVWEEGETLELARSRARDACSRLSAAGLRMVGCRGRRRRPAGGAGRCGRAAPGLGVRRGLDPAARPLALARAPTWSFEPAAFRRAAASSTSSANRRSVVPELDADDVGVSRSALARAD
jgi:hypothetical protein